MTVLANATELFGSIDQSMPKFEQWVHDAMGINASGMLNVRGEGAGPLLTGWAAPVLVLVICVICLICLVGNAGGRWLGRQLRL